MAKSNIGDKVNSVAQTAAAVSTMSTLKENLSKFNEQKAKEAKELARKQMKQKFEMKRYRVGMCGLVNKGGAKDGK